MRDLNGLPFELFSELLNNSLDTLGGFVPKEIVFKSEYSLKELEEIKEVLNEILMQLLYTNITSEDVSKVFDIEKCKLILETFALRKFDIALGWMLKHNATIKPVLSHFDWKLNWIVGSSVSTSLRYPILCLELSTLSKSENKLQNKIINFELTKDELDKLILSLENLNNQ